ncbi:MAG: HPr family phosphocarrier protein [Anaerotignum sp.]
MIERKVILRNQTGLHDHPASEVAAFAKQLPCKVYLSHNGKKAAADSIRQLLTLEAREGSELMLSADGEGDKHSVEKLEAFLRILEG